jgi:transcriptional regulator with XRE-family HTH domain
MDIERYSRMLGEAETDAAYWHAVPATEFAEEIAHRMKRRGVSRAELARRLGTTRANVTKLLRGDANLKLNTMVKIALALEGVVHTHVSDRNVITRWVDRTSAQATAGDFYIESRLISVSGTLKVTRLRPSTDVETTNQQFDLALRRG